MLHTNFSLNFKLLFKSYKCYSYSRELTRIVELYQSSNHCDYPVTISLSLTLTTTIVVCCCMCIHTHAFIMRFYSSRFIILFELNIIIRYIL